MLGENLSNVRGKISKFRGNLPITSKIRGGGIANLAGSLPNFLGKPNKFGEKRTKLIRNFSKVREKIYPN